MQVARVAEIRRYPFKSMQGERLESVALAKEGIRGDRSWAARDEERGGIEGARKLPALLGCSARFPSPVPETGPCPVPQITLPGGQEVSANAPEATALLSQLVGRKLSLWPQLPASEEEHYRRGAPDNPDMLEELRAIFGRLPDEPLPDIGKFPPEIMTASTLPGTYFDVSPLFLLTQASLETIGQAWPDVVFDVRRFRPNLLLSSEDSSGFPENAWVGKRLRIGEAELEVSMECPRCVMTTHAFLDVPKDPKVMRALVKENGGNLGVYAAVVKPGVIAEDDPVELIG